MSTTIAAVYEQGTLRLLDPVALDESSQVQVQILPANGDGQATSFERQLVSTQQLLSAVENEWINDLVRDVFPRLLQEDLRTLWHLCQPPYSTLCAMLQLAAAHLQSDNLTHEQIAAIRLGLDFLSQPDLTEANIYECHQRLTASGLSPAFALDAETVQSYLDEL